MKKIIHNLRQQPEEVRRPVLHLSTFVLGIVLVLLWVYSLGARASSSSIKVEISENLEPLTELQSNIIDGYNNISNFNLNNN